MKILTAVAGVTGVLTLGVAGPVLAAGAGTPPPSPVVGHVYVNDNTPGVNTIGEFDRHANGTLTAAPGSPFVAGGAGLGAGTGSQGSLEQTPDGRFLLAVDAGSNQISVLRILPTGALQSIPGGVVSSGGAKPVSIAVTSRLFSEDLVYVANAGAGGSNYTGFTLDAVGDLHPIAHSSYALPAGSNPGDVLFNGAGTALAGTRVGTSLVDSFTVGVDGLLTAAPGSPFSTGRLGQIGAEFRPTNPNQLFVSNAHDGAGLGSVSAFQDSPNGTLTTIGSGPVADLQTAPCWVEISHDGRFLFAVNTAVPSISSYAIAPNGSLTLQGSLPLNPITEKGPVDARLSPNGSTLYVVDGGGQAVSSFAVHGGTLTELASSPVALPVGASPEGIVVN